ncbi:hypothetical protein ABPG74_016227 [Tetrahymena malaccensis]
MKTFIIIALISSSMLLSLCLAQYTKPEDQKTSCAYIGKNNNRYVDSNSDSLQRCIFCQYKYNDPSDPVYGGCASCPDSQGKCRGCVNGYVLFNGKCISCGNGVKSCTITNQNFSTDPTIQQVLADIRSSTKLTTQQKNIEEMKIHQQYLAIRADECFDSSSSDGVIVEMGSICKKIQNCEKVDRTPTTVSCSKCKASFFFDQNFSCVNQCQANIVSFNFSSSKYENAQPQICSECTYDGKCKTCPAGTVEVSSNNLDAIQNLSPKVCQKCMNNCQSCSVSDSLTGHIKCDVCQAGFFYNSAQNTCDQCSIESLLINPLDYQKDDQKNFTQLVCSGNSFSQINWSASQVIQTDALNQKFKYSIMTENNQAFVCGKGAIECQLQNGKVINNKCLYGYALKDNECVSCDQLAKNSILCQYNKNLNTYIPTLCKVGSQFDIPYADSYSLQITIDQVDTLVKDSEIQYKDVPSPDEWCQLNSNKCKSFVSLRQKLILKLEDKNFFGICSDCFTDSDIPDQYKKTDQQDFFKADNGAQRCYRCSDIPNAVSCQFNEDKSKLLPQKCASTFTLDSTKENCVALDKSQILDNCLIQEEVNGKQQCKVCAKNYQLNDANICEAIKIENCDEMEGTTCKRCVQDGKQYYLKDNKCISIPQGCASYQNGSCSICQYSYKPVNITEVQVCVPCYQEFNTLQSYIQYDCPGKVKKSSLENDEGMPVQPKSNSMVLLFSVISFILFMMF